MNNVWMCIAMEDCSYGAVNYETHYFGKRISGKIVKTRALTLSDHSQKINQLECFGPVFL